MPKGWGRTKQVETNAQAEPNVDDDRFRTSDGVLITDGMRVVDYDRRNAVVRIAGTQADPANESHVHWNGWFEMETPDGQSSSTMNGERLLAGWTDDPYDGPTATELAEVNAQVEGYRAAEANHADADPDAEITDEDLAAIEDDAADAESAARDAEGESAGEQRGWTDEELAEAKEYAWSFNWDTLAYDPELAKRYRTKRGVAKPCLCNRLHGHECELTTKTRFAIGHDARFKGILQKAYRAGEELLVDFVEEDGLVAADVNDGVRRPVIGQHKMVAEEVARLLAPKLLPHVTHETRAQRQKVADAEAGTTTPRSAVEA